MIDLSGKLAENVGISGVKQIFEQQSGQCRRIIWILALLSVTTWLSVQFHNNVSTYLRYPTTVSKQVVSPENVAFPAVTLCNANPLKARHVFNMQKSNYSSPTMYEAITDYYRILSPTPGSEKEGVLKERFLKVTGPYLDTEFPSDLYLLAAQQADDLIFSCRWKGGICGPEHFSPTLTDAGLCFTFNDNTSLVTDREGTEGGLSLVLSLEPCDYIRGPRSAIGALIYIHNQSERPTLITNKGMTIASGTWTSITLHETTEENLPAPHGNCGSSPFSILSTKNVYSLNNCVLDRLASYVLQRCGCLFFFMRGLLETKECTFTETIECVQPAVGRYLKQDEFYNHTNRSGYSGCGVPCRTVNYDLTLTQVQLSERYIVSTAGETFRTSEAGDTGPPTHDQDPDSVQAWTFLNELNRNITDAISQAVENILLFDNIITDIVKDVDIIGNVDKGRASLLDSYQSRLSVWRNVLLNKKSCPNREKFRPCLNARVAAEMLKIGRQTTHTCPVVLTIIGYIVGIHDSFSRGLNDSTHHNVTYQGEQEEEVVNMTAMSELSTLKELYKRLDDKYMSARNTLDKTHTLCDYAYGKVAAFWKTFHFSREDVVNMIRNPGPNLMKVDVSLTDMTVTEVKQIQAYPWISLIGDIGGTLGLCLGGSVLTLVEIIDIVVTWGMHKRAERQVAKESLETKEDPENISELGVIPSVKGIY